MRQLGSYVTRALSVFDPRAALVSGTALFFDSGGQPFRPPTPILGSDNALRIGLGKLLDKGKPDETADWGDWVSFRDCVVLARCEPFAARE